MCHWVDAVHPAQKELKISRTADGEAREKQRRGGGGRDGEENKTFLTCLPCSVLTKKEISLQDTATLFMRNEVSV